MPSVEFEAEPSWYVSLEPIWVSRCGRFKVREVAAGGFYVYQKAGAGWAFIGLYESRKSAEAQCSRVAARPTRRKKTLADEIKALVEAD